MQEFVSLCKSIPLEVSEANLTQATALLEPIQENEQIPEPISLDRPLPKANRKPRRSP